MYQIYVMSVNDRDIRGPYSDINDAIAERNYFNSLISDSATELRYDVIVAKAEIDLNDCMILR